MSTGRTTGQAAAGRGAPGVLARLAGVGLLLAAAGCGGARHRKVAGPPPEYELPEVAGAAGAAPSDASPARASGAPAP
jgi:hypothetical protein